MSVPHQHAVDAMRPHVPMAVDRSGAKLLLDVVAPYCRAALRLRQEGCRLACPAFMQVGQGQ